MAMMTYWSVEVGWLDYWITGSVGFCKRDACRGKLLELDVLRSGGGMWSMEESELWMAWTWAAGELCLLSCLSKERSTVELDDEGGRTFLRVLIHLIMQDYPPLVSGSLQLIFKHFSQRADVLQAFKQVSTSLRLSAVLQLLSHPSLIESLRNYQDISTRYRSNWMI